jgi:SAM-dependent methyltransferase
MWPTEQNRQAWDNRHRGGEGGDDDARLPDAVRERLPDLQGKHVLHLPSGTGAIAAELIGLGALVTGVDPDERALSAARERAPDAAFFQAELHELPLQFRRGRFDLVYAGDGTLASVPELVPFMAGLAAGLRKNGQLIVHDWHPVAACVEPVGLRWRESYFRDDLWRLGQIVAATAEAGLVLQELEELPPPVSETGGRLDPRIPTSFVLHARKTEPVQQPARRRRAQ